ncbi:MAG TPA: hypothetical protein VF761_16780 [Gemmatimonadaceae bacterium]
METTNAVAQPSSHAIPTAPVRIVKRCASTIAVGDQIMPPARELRLWLRRNLAEKGMTEAEAIMTVTEVKQGAPDKRGPWLLVTAFMPDAWYAECPSGPYPWTFHIRPDTLWPVVVGGAR